MPAKPNTAEPQKPRRRWFQFRLWTLLIGLALLGSVCEWAIRPVWQAHKRTAMVYRIGQLNGMVQLAGIPAVDPQSAPPVSLIRRFMGDFDVAEIDLPVEAIAQMNAAERRQFRDAFPEATIRAVRWPALAGFNNGSGRGPKPEDYPQYFPFPDIDTK